jgi:hypothetical protein
MAFTPEQVEEFIATLQQDATLRDRVRNAILADDFLALPGLVRALAEDVGDLRTSIQALSREVEQLTRQMSKLTGRVDNLDGEMFEHNFERKLSSWMGPRFRRPTVIDPYAFEAIDNAFDSGSITETELADLAGADLLVLARDGRGSSAPEVVLAVEVSVTVDVSDVTRAVRRTATLSKCGLRALSVVAGARITSPAKAAAERLGTVALIRKQAAEDEDSAA